MPSGHLLRRTSGGRRCTCGWRLHRTRGTGSAAVRATAPMPCKNIRVPERRERKCQDELGRHGSHRVRIVAVRGPRAAAGAHVRRREACRWVRRGRRRAVDPWRIEPGSSSSRARRHAEQALSELHTLEVKDRDAVVVSCSENGQVKLKQTHQIAAGEGVVAAETIRVHRRNAAGRPCGWRLAGHAFRRRPGRP